MAALLKRINRAAIAETRTHKKLFLIVQLILGLAAVLYGFESYAYNRYYQNMSAYQEPGMACALFGIASVCGFFICSALFKDMHNVQTADVSHSLPMKASERYAAKILSLFYIHILPLIVWSLAAAISAAAVCSYNKTVLGMAMKFTLFIFLLALAAALFTDAVSVFCCCCCGTMAESIYFPIITAGCLSVAPSVFLYKMVYGFSGQNYSGDYDQYLCGWTYSIVLSVNSYNSGSGFYISCAVNCLISLAVIFACVFIYKKRDARTVGNPIVFRLMFELMMFLGVFTVFITVVFEDMIHIGLIAALVAYLVINIVVSRAKITLRSAMVWLLKFAASIAVFVGIMAAGYVTDGFGAINYIPSDDKLENTHVMITLKNEYGNSYTDYESTDLMNADQAKEIIKLVHSYNGTREKSVGEFFKILSRGIAYKSRYFYDGYYMLPNDSSGFAIYINQYITDEDDVIEDDVIYGSTVYEQTVVLPRESVEKLLADCEECGLLEECSRIVLE